MGESDSDTCFNPAASLANLPDDCLFNIFRNLTNYADRNAFGLTCRRWLHIQNHACSSLNFHLTRKSNVKELYADNLPRLLARFPNLISISLANCTELCDSALSQFRDSGSLLRSLSLYCCLGISDDALSTVAAGCPNLVSITLYRCNITDVGLGYLAESCPALESVNISYCMSITDDGVAALSRYCHSIYVLIISNCKGIKGMGFNGCSPTLTYLEADSCSLTVEGLHGVVSGGSLEYLNLSSLKSWLSSESLDAIGSGFAARLRFLNLRMCRFVGDESVEAIATGCPVLEEWSLAVCHGVHAAGWEAIGLNCKALKILHVNRCRNLCDQGLQSLRDGCNQLKVIYMHSCGKVTTHGMETFKLLRQDVEVRREEHVCIGPCLDKFFHIIC